MTEHRFNVSSRIALLLGESYKRIEQALKELVDNAWDADAKVVTIEVPDGPAASPTIIITDDGEGMSPAQIGNDYLRIARDRRKDRGPRTKRGRLVKGRKGVGKFAGIIVAGHMKLVTRQGGRESTIAIDRLELENGPADIEKIDVPVAQADCDTSLHGTAIILSDLFNHINYPTPAALRHALAPEYSRQDEVKVIINGEPLTHLQVLGHTVPQDIDVPGTGPIRAEFVIAEKKQTKAMRGILVRVAGKTIGEPQLFGLDEDEMVPKKLLEYVTGELHADCLEGAATTCGWTEFFESDKSVQAVFATAREHLRSELNAVFQREMSAARARYYKKYGPRIDGLPDDKRARAKEEIDRILARHFRDDERREQAIELLLRTLEQDDHWVISKKILAAKPADVAALAQALKELNLADIALVGKQTMARLTVLDKLRELIGNDATREEAVHFAIKNSLWVFGYEFALISSDQRLSKVISTAFGAREDGPERDKRPDLLLLNRFKGRYLLVEFKRPSLSLDWDHKTQAERYHAQLQRHASPLDIIVLGGTRRPDLEQQYEGGRLRMVTYTELISQADSELRWLLSELKRDALEGTTI